VKLFPFVLMVCACGVSEVAVEGIENDDALMSERQDIVDVEQTPAKRQAIGNCWVYATASWAESMTKTSTGRSRNFSETYWTYWHWFDQISAGAGTISTGGNFSTMKRIIATYGVMEEGDFLPEEATAEMSTRQASALAAINQALSTGALSTTVARRNRTLVRQELDRAFGLRPKLVTELNTVFGADVSRSIRSFEGRSALLIKPEAIAVSYVSTASGAIKKTTLKTALSEWTESYYPSSTASAASRRAMQKRFQRALHARVPVMLTWFVDFNSLNSSGQFLAKPTTPGRQGFHMTVAEDYEATNVPTYGTLPAGKVETRPEALEAALSDATQLTFIRTKNSWGTFRADRGFVSGYPGYHDLHFAYLDGPVKQCREKNGTTDSTDCPWSVTPLVSIIMPRGF
jgi:hypothetical protein